MNSKIHAKSKSYWVSEARWRLERYKSPVSGRGLHYLSAESLATIINALDTGSYNPESTPRPERPKNPRAPEYSGGLHIYLEQRFGIIISQATRVPVAVLDALADGLERRVAARTDAA